MIVSTSLPYSSSSVSNPPRSANSTGTGSIASITSATENSCSVSMSTTTSGVPSSCASNPRSATWRNGIASNRSAMWPSTGMPSDSGTSSSDSTTLRRPPTRPTVSRPPTRVERRMIAQASCSASASMASRTEEASVMARTLVAGLGHPSAPPEGDGTGRAQLTVVSSWVARVSTT